MADFIREDLTGARPEQVEEWEHRLFAERDLDVLESRGTPQPGAVF